MTQRKSMMSNNRVCYGVDWEEKLDASLEDTIERLKDEGATGEVNIYEFSPMKIKLNAEWILEDILESLDDEYGDPDSNEYTKPTAAMIEAADKFVEVVKKEYYVYACEKTGRVFTVSIE